MGRFRTHRPAPPPTPRQTVVTCSVSAGTQPGGPVTVTITPHDDQAPLLLFVDPQHVVMATPLTDGAELSGQLKVTLLHIKDELATVQLPAPVVGLGLKITIPKTLLASIPGHVPTKGSRP